MCKAYEKRTIVRIKVYNLERIKILQETETYKSLEILKTDIKKKQAEKKLKVRCISEEQNFLKPISVAET